MLKGKLYLIPCSISEGDPLLWLPANMASVIKNTEYYLVENLRTSRRFISSLKLGVEIPSLHLSVLDKNTSEQELEKMIKPLTQGHNMGVMSESGCPGVADPGSMAVAWAHRHNVEVIPLVGPSSILMALMASGFNGQKFCFHGYLPIKDKERRKSLLQLELESAKLNQTQIFIETPYRNMQMLESILSSCKNNTQLCVAQDISGESQFIKTLPVANWKKDVPKLEKLPVVFLLQSGVFH